MAQSESPAPVAARPAGGSADTPARKRPGWLTAMAAISLVTALLWLLVAVLIAVLLVFLRVLEEANPQLAIQMPLDETTGRQLAWMGALDFVCAIWLLLAAWTAYRCRPVTRPLHNGLAVARIGLLLLWLVRVVGSADAPSFIESAVPGVHIPSSPLALAVIGVIELIYPVAILIVFNKSTRREQLERLCLLTTGAS